MIVGTVMMGGSNIAGSSAFAHGITQGVATQLRGGDFKSGFIGGFVGKISAHYARPYLGVNPVQNATIHAVIAGVVSKAKGGVDFTNIYLSLFSAMSSYTYIIGIETIYAIQKKDFSKHFRAI